MEWARIYSSSEHCGREGRWRGLGEGGQRGVAGTAWGLPHHVQQCSCPLLELWGALVLLQGPVPTVSDEVSSSLRAVQEEEVQQLQTLTHGLGVGQREGGQQQGQDQVLVQPLAEQRPLHCYIAHDCQDQHSGHLGTGQELQQGREQVQGEQSRAEEGLMGWGGQGRNVSVELRF